jgi:DNA mismatch repair protein MutS2
MISENALNLLEFHKLLGVVSQFSHSEASRKAVCDIRPLTSRGEIEKRFGVVHEVRRLSQEGVPLRLSRFSDISPLLIKIRPQGAVLDPSEIAVFIPFLQMVSEISSQMEGRRDLPFLHELTGNLTGFPEILAVLTRSVDAEGNILDSASPMLAELRGQVRRLETRIGKKLEEIMRDERLSVFLQDTFITERSGRWVIPVRMDSKGQVPGVVHDVSRSGETAFIEPLEIIHLSNELENLVAEQKAEEIRILRTLCSKIRAVDDSMDTQYKILVYLDLLNCIARFADELQMHSLQIRDSGRINLEGARHPLLSLALRKTEDRQVVVPLDVRLGGDTTVMVITGSNAGGKTIAIKTIGIIVLMALSGMPVPASPSSSISLMNDLLIDIGDEQSIENNLSTFSAHISNIAEILKKADEQSLILIDELGTGTDPAEGAALACAVLKEIKTRRALLFATTHLTDIKGFVHRTEGMVNASMEFDQESLTPLYRLRVGEPGQSHALEIGRRYGLPENIIASARDMLGTIKVELDSLIADLNEKRAHYEHGLSELRNQQEKIEERAKLLRQDISEAETRKKEILGKALSEASEIITDTKRQMHAVLDEIRKEERTKRREVIKEVLKEVDDHHGEVIQRLREYIPNDYRIPQIDTIRKGDVVYVRSLGYDTSVVEVDKKHTRIRVRSGGMEIDVSLSDIGCRRGRSAEQQGEAVTLHAGEETVSSKITLVGLRVDDALSRLEPFLNHASLAGLSEITIIHGIGTGTLSRAVHEHLSSHPLIKHFRKGTPREGGAGATVVSLA